MPEVENFTAADAKAMYEEARSLNGSYLRDETNSILRNIEGCAKAGQDWISIKGLLSPVITDRLVSVGFKVVPQAASSGYPSSVTISW